MNVLAELRKVGRSLYPKAPPIPVMFNDVGQIGHVERRRGLYVNSGIRHHVSALVRDHYRAERTAREISNGRLGAGDILPIAALGTDSRDAIRAIKSMRSAIASWDNVVAAIEAGKFWNYMGSKASQTTVANAWFAFNTVAGNPGAMTYGTIPNPVPANSDTAGAWPLPMSLGASENLYMTNFGTNHATGTNIVLAVDLIYSAGGILASVVTSQGVSTSALPRWTGGQGLQMTLEVTVAAGTATGIPNVRINYTDQSGNAGADTGNISLGTTSPIVGRMLPLQDGPMIRLASGDFGIQNVSQITFSGSMAGAGGRMALHIYRPLLLVPTLATTAFVERSTPAQIGGIRKLTSVAQGSKPCIGFFVLCSTTSTGAQTYLLETVYG